MKNNDIKSNRRNILKTCAASVGVGGLASINAISTRAAKQDGFLIGQRSFTEIQIYYDVPNNARVAHADGKIEYLTDASSEQLGILNGDLVNNFENSERLVVTNGTLYNGSRKINHNPTKSLPITSEFNIGSERAILVEREISHPTIRIGDENRNGITASIIEEGSEKKHSVTVGPGETVENSLSPIEVEPYDNRNLEPTEEQEEKDNQLVEPNVRIKNHGELNIYGKEGYSVVPANHQDDYVDHFLAVHRQKLDSNTLRKPSQDLIIVDRGENDD